MKYHLLFVPLLLAGCQSAGIVSTANTSVIAACDTNSAAVSVLADLRRAGSLSASTVDLVNRDIALVNPICSSPSTAPALTAAQTAAFAELKSLAGVK